jgi:AcrR family transcriptional regulator
MSISTADSPRSIRDARRDMYRSQVVAAAELVFARSGFAAARVSAIAQAANVSLSTLYKNFEGKTEIWDALHDVRMEQAVTAATESAARGRTALDQLLLASHAIVLFFADQPHYLEIHVNSGIGWATADDAWIGAGSQERSWRTGRDILVRAAAAAVRDGLLRPLKPELIAGVIISSEQLWLTDWLKAGRDRSPSEVADELVEHLRRTLS